MCHKKKPVTVFCEFLHLLFDHDDRDAGGGQRVHSRKHLFRAGRIELRCRFIQNQNLRLHRENRGNRNPLHLSAGQIKGILLPELPHIETLERFLNPCLDFLPRNTEILKPVSNLIVDRVGRAGQLMKGILENKSDLFDQLGNRRFCSIHTIKKYSTTIRTLIELRHEPEKGLRERALSSPICPDDTDERTLFDGKAKIIEHQSIRTRITIFKMGNFD